VAVDGSGTKYVTDTGNNRVLKPWLGKHPAGQVISRPRTPPKKRNRRTAAAKIADQA
jgi:hypothetical protein